MTDSPEAPARTLRIALVGNPNTGKTTLFNALTGLRQKVGNYPGVTVERRAGTRRLAGGVDAEIIDLPGTYSLSGRAPDEEIAVAALLGEIEGERAPDVIVDVCDATNPGRNLYLTTQLLELGRPVVVALNMMDLARAEGPLPDPVALEEVLGVPVVAIEDHSAASMEGLMKAAEEAARGPAPRRVVRFPEELEAAVEAAREGRPFGGAMRDRVHGPHEEWWRREPQLRYAWIDERMPKLLAAPRRTETSATDRIDAVVLHRFFGPVLFLVVMAVVFQGIFRWAEAPMNLLEAAFGLMSAHVGAWIGPGMLRDLVVDGVLTGVLNVVIFLPQILLLFLAIGLLEDSGYLARAAFLMDGPMRRCGLHGRSFVPMMSSFACAIPGIMAARTIESRAARLVTILVAPLMSCSARLPVYTLVIGAFFAKSSVAGFSVAGLVLLAMYLLGIVAAVAMAWLFRRTLVRGETPTLIMELPPYRAPRLGTVLRQMAERGYLFVRKAGTVILALTVVLWFLQTFPRDEALLAELGRTEAGLEAAGGDERAPLETRARRIRGELLSRSFAGRVGHAVEPLIEPLGFDWRIGIGLVASFAAREVLVPTLAQVFSVDDSEEGVAFLQAKLREARDPADGRLLYRPLTGLSLMVFFVLACQCMSTVAVVRRETNGWRWPLFMVAYMTTLAYGASFLTFTIGSRLGY